ncbi:GNAT family N-acetyltransferase [Neobacillus cucumis]|uniref:N-acetyltransferase n=1 Tax=Neobacillus cucumis TaxID=1740721 RepID=A0A2N5HVY6_9BACI|nr:GNAT family N-acetyltransferase [Neobacillus cucumis]PLS09682.1 N-acetyltransferase [Neobacillus cucumis]
MTFDEWDDQLWDQISPIYYQAFADKGAKPEKIIRNMFRKQLCFLHIGLVDGKVAAMALTGKLKKVDSLLIDYLAVEQTYRGSGLGLQMIKCIEEWAVTSGSYNHLIIEVEAEETTENLARIAFWKKCGFTLTDYIHQYIWVPEPYQAMYKNLQLEEEISSDGRTLFNYIGKFHKKSFLF